MDIILHLGAHRTATTSFQYYLRKNAARLGWEGIVVLGPRQTRNGLFSGVFAAPGATPAAQQLRRARGRIALRLERERAKGARVMVISDENMIGAPRRNLRDMRLYADIGQRMARYHDAFDGRIGRVVLSIRAQDCYWNSVIAFAIERGGAVPSPARISCIAQGARGWRDVIGDLACALPDVAIEVMVHETYASLPERKLEIMTGAADLPRTYAREWLNRAPDLAQLRALLKERGIEPGPRLQGDGRGQFFDEAQVAALREAYADDLFWLRSGADGLAVLTEETDPEGVGQTPPAGVNTRGQSGEKQNRRMA